MLARVVQAKAVVEIGTGSGVSGLALFAGMQPDGILTSVDIETEHQQAAREAFLSVGIPTQRFRLIAGSALNVLPRLSDGAYDLVFVDADKVEYAEYVEQGVRLLRHGGVLAVDNALWHDRTADADQHRRPDRVDPVRPRRGAATTRTWSPPCCRSATACWSPSSASAAASVGAPGDGGREPLFVAKATTSSSRRIGRRAARRP